MKKWFLKPEWSKADEEGQSVVFEEAQHDPDDFPPPPPLDEEDDEGSYDAATPTPPQFPVEAEGVEGVEQVSEAARKRFSELFEQEVKPRRLFQVGLMRLDVLWWCRVLWSAWCSVVVVHDKLPWCSVVVCCGATVYSYTPRTVISRLGNYYCWLLFM